MKFANPAVLKLAENVMKYYTRQCLEVVDS